MKLVKIDTCKNLFCILLFFVTFFSIIVLFSNAYGEPVNVNSLSNSSDVQDLNKTTNSHSLSENIIDNKKANQLTEKFFALIKQINDTKAVIEVFPITFNGAVIKNDTNSSQSDLLSLHKNDTFKEVNNTGFLPPPPPTISHIENEIDPMDATNFVLKYIENERVPMNATNFVLKDSDRNASEEEDDDESSRNASEEEDDDESSRNASEEEDDDESSRNASEEEDDDESSRNASEENTREFYFKKSNVVSNNKLIGNKTIGNSIDNENDKLISQFSELNSSVIRNLQIQTDDSNSKTKDRKPIANAGLDQVITTDQNIVLDASASFDPEGKISSYLWKQTGNSEGKINSSNSMIYSFPIPEGLEEKSLEFKLIVMDEKGQKDMDTINFLINNENDEES
ncbi:MAG TPA: hypothetical protein VFY77_07300 [Nitrososphaeraceae archaeon]|nr:hypothetical protein [Nitrososphaeraceae archaeon]